MGSTSWSPQAQKSEPRLDIFFLYVGLWGPQILMELTELILKWMFSSDRQDRCKPSMLTSFMWHGKAAWHSHSPREISAQKQKVPPKGHANSRGNRWFRTEEQNEGPRLAFPDPCLAPL